MLVPVIVGEPAVGVPGGLVAIGTVADEVGAATMGRTVPDCIVGGLSVRCTMVVGCDWSGFRGTIFVVEDGARGLGCCCAGVANRMPDVLNALGTATA